MKMLSKVLSWAISVTDYFLSFSKACTRYTLLNWFAKEVKVVHTLYAYKYLNGKWHVFIFNYYGEKQNAGFMHITT